MIASSENLELSFRPYRRAFSHPLRAAWGTWSLREGIILRLEHPESGTVGFGEIAPLEPFGTESLETGLRHVFSLPRRLNVAAFEDCLPEAPPATAFGLYSALQSMKDPPDPQIPMLSAALITASGLPEQLQALRNAGSRTFKVKVGTQQPQQEQCALEAVIAELSGTESLRLDPNQSWDQADWANWLPWLAINSQHIEFVEEPFAADTCSLEDLLGVARDSPVPLALDESLSRDGIQQWIQAGWPGFWVIKPSLHGDPESWLPGLSSSDKVILSSVFETGIGLSAILQLAAKVKPATHGLGTQAFFNDAIGITAVHSALPPLTIGQQEFIWNHLPDD